MTGAASKGLAILVSAITLPLTVRYLGKLQYGIWVTISTSVMMFAVLDLGIANTLTNFISRAFAESDDVMAQRYFATALWITAAISVVLGLCGAVMLHWLDFGSLFRLHGDMQLAAQARSSTVICFIFFLLGLPLNLANRVLSGYQEVHIANGFAMASSGFGLVAIVATVLMHGGLVALTAAFCVVTLLGALMLNLWLCFWHRPGIRPVPAAVDFSVGQQLFGGGMLFFILQVASLVVFNTDNLIIAHYLGAAEVTPYSVAWRLCGYATMFQSLLIPSLWPAFSEAYHRRDLDWIRKNHRRFMRGSVPAVAAVALLIALLGRPVIRIWAGPAAVPGTALLWCMALWAVILAFTSSQALLFAATQRLQVQAICGIIAVLVNLPLSIFLVQRMGAIGVLLATLSTYVVFIVIPQAWEVRRILAGRYLEKMTC